MGREIQLTELFFPDPLQINPKSTNQVKAQGVYHSPLLEGPAHKGL